jgi:hypothetical protein
LLDSDGTADGTDGGPFDFYGTADSKVKGSLDFVCTMDHFTMDHLTWMASPRQACGSMDWDGPANDLLDFDGTEDGMNNRSLDL